MSPSLASQLCLQCAICCDGTLFSMVPLSSEEARSLLQRGFELSRHASGRSSLSLGCQALEGCRCTQYDVRPGACRAFRCDLCVAVEEGRVELKDALEVIEEAKRLRRKAFDRDFESFLAQHLHRIAR